MSKKVAIDESVFEALTDVSSRAVAFLVSHADKRPDKKVRLAELAVAVRKLEDALGSEPTRPVGRIER